MCFCQSQRADRGDKYSLASRFSELLMYFLFLIPRRSGGGDGRWGGGGGLEEGGGVKERCCVSRSTSLAPRC